MEDNISVTVTQDDWNEAVAARTASRAEGKFWVTDCGCALAKAVERSIGRKFAKREGCGYQSLTLMGTDDIVQFAIPSQLEALAQSFDSESDPFPGETSGVLVRLG